MTQVLEMIFLVWVGSKLLELIYGCLRDRYIVSRRAKKPAAKDVEEVLSGNNDERVNISELMYMLTSGVKRVFNRK